MRPATLLKSAIFPVVSIGSLAIFAALLSSGLTPAFAVLAVSLGSLTVIAALEVFFPYRPEWGWWKDRQTINDLIHGVLLSTVGPRLGEIALASVIAAGSAALATSETGMLWPTGWPLWGQLALAIVYADFVEWGKHWAYHHWAFAWPIHALHHNVDQMHVAKAARLNFLEATIRFAIINVPLLILGAPAEVFIWYAALVTVLGNLNHSNIDMPMPDFVHYLFASPKVHWIHHARDHDLGRSNLSSVTMLPDLIFGTFRHPAKYPFTEVGIDNNRIPPNVFGQVAAPLLWPWLKPRVPEIH